MATEKITVSKIEKARPVAGKDTYLWDMEVKGFGVKITPSGSKVFLLQYHQPVTLKSRRLTFGALTKDFGLHEAKGLALEALRLLRTGVDPASPSPVSTETSTTKPMTVADLCDLYLSEGCDGKKESTLVCDRSRIKNHIIPMLGSMVLASVRRADVERLLVGVKKGDTKTTERKMLAKPRASTKVTGGQGTATRTVGLLGAIMTFAVRRGLVPSNPCSGVKRYKDRKVERFLSPEELAHLGSALDAVDAAKKYPRAGTDALRMLVLTGCRKQEILDLEWRWVDLHHRCLRLPDSKTGQKIVPLGAAAVDYLKAMKARDPDARYVFASPETGKPYAGLPKLWVAVCKRAQLKDLRVHDLRHAFASVGASGGDSLPVIGAILGHADATTTQRYAHLQGGAVRAAADRISTEIASAMAVPLWEDMDFDGVFPA